MARRLIDMSGSLQAGITTAAAGFQAAGLRFNMKDTSAGFTCAVAILGG